MNTPSIPQKMSELCPNLDVGGTLFRHHLWDGGSTLSGCKLLISHFLDLAQILEAREQLTQNFRYQTKLESNEGTIAPTFNNADGNGTVPTPVEVAPSLKYQDASTRATSFGNVDYGILETIHLDAPSKDTISDARAVSSNNISSSVPIQLVPVLRDAAELSQSGMEESIHAFSKEDVTEFSQCRIEESTPDFTVEDAIANEQNVTLVDSAPSKEDQQRQLVSDLSEQSRSVIQKADNEYIDDDGDEWLEEDPGGSGSTHVQIADDDEDVSFSDLEEDDDAA